MNLKAAAQQLGVHYQTAYKWVRSGSLTAVRVGSRYQISEAAITQFLATRRGLLSEVGAGPPARRATDLTQDDVLAELEAMLSDPLVAGASVATFAARRGAEVLGDVCVAVLMCDDRRTILYSAIDHPEPDRAAFVSALTSTVGAPHDLLTNAASEPYLTGRTVRIPHVPQDELRASVPTELRQYLPQYAIHSVLAAPILAGETTVGFLVFGRDTASRPYTAADEEFAGRMGTRLGLLARTAGEIALAWEIRSELDVELRRRMNRRPPGGGPTPTELDGLFAAHLGGEALPAAVLDRGGHFLAANALMVKSTGHSAEELVGMDYLELARMDQRVGQQHDFSRLVSGEVDFLDINAHRWLEDGTEHRFGVHRAALRGPDATLEYVIAVCRPIYVAADRPQLVEAS